MYMRSERVIVNDKMQKNYVYFRTQEEGKGFDDGFTPDLSPIEMLSIGIFGGVYLRDCIDEYPEHWFEKAVLSTGKKDPELNFFGVDASKPLAYWREKNWIHPEDPRGWFQWYCRYYSGRRHEDDKRQIARWKAMKRHVAQLQKHCTRYDFGCRPRQRQALLHWAYDSRSL